VVLGYWGTCDLHPALFLAAVLLALLLGVKDGDVFAQPVVVHFQHLASKRALVAHFLPTFEYRYLPNSTLHVGNCPTAVKCVGVGVSEQYLVAAYVHEPRLLLPLPRPLLRPTTQAILSHSHRFHCHRFHCPRKYSMRYTLLWTAGNCWWAGSAEAYLAQLHHALLLVGLALQRLRQHQGHLRLEIRRRLLEKVVIHT
jgi:hypothetical protein